MNPFNQKYIAPPPSTENAKELVKRAEENNPRNIQFYQKEN